MPIVREDGTAEPSEEAWEFKGTPPDDPSACSAAAKWLAEVAKNEEARFSNLNTRAAAVLSAASVVAGILGLTAKNVLDGSLDTWQLRIAAAGLVATLVLLASTTGELVFKVLKPKARSIFGDNDLTTRASQALDTYGVDKVAFVEYGKIYSSLAARSSDKAQHLNHAYHTLFWALAVGALAVAIVVILELF